MTCQWCIHFRNRGVAACTWPGRPDGRIIPAKERTECPGFDPRRVCSTCEHRCDYAERESSGGSYGECDRWVLRTLSSWGGNRKRGGRPKASKREEQISGSPVEQTSTTTNQGEKQ